MDSACDDQHQVDMTTERMTTRRRIPYGQTCVADKLVALLVAAADVAFVFVAVVVVVAVAAEVAGTAVPRSLLAAVVACSLVFLLEDFVVAAVEDLQMILVKDFFQ